MVLFTHTLRQSRSSTLSLAREPKLARVRLEPNVLRCVRSAHPVRKPMIEFSGGFLGARRISVSREDRILLRIGHAARSVSVRYTCERCVHRAGSQFGVGNRAGAAGLVYVYFAAVLC